jgi:FKBP-type peptidyl-prolyl cis-trans isomerase FkpA
LKTTIKDFHRFLLLPAIVFTLSLASCGHDAEKVNSVDPLLYKDPLVNANKKLVKTEDEQIEDYIQRYGWKMTKTGTGLRYLIYQKGAGLKPEKGMTAQIRFKVNLINGAEVYNSEKDGMKSFGIGKNEVESGLEEGIMLMHAGDKAKLVIPSHLAYGLLGDDKLIPKRATLIYDLELVRLY